MSVDTMAAHDDGLDEARAIVNKFLPLKDCGEPNCEICPVIKKKRKKILIALELARQQGPRPNRRVWVPRKDGGFHITTEKALRRRRRK